VTGAKLFSTVGITVGGELVDDVAAQEIIDYTAAPAGLIVKGRLWTGAQVASTAFCGKCGRIGVVSDDEALRQLVVHKGLVVSGTLQGIEYCELSFHSRQHTNRM
jgi:hypothetical protein